MNKKIFTTIKDLKIFLILWTSQSISTLGSSMTSYALILWVFQQTHSVMGTSKLAVFSYLPSIIFSFFAGALVDRCDKKKIMILCDTIAAAGTLTIFILMASGNISIWHIYVVNIVLSLMNSFQTPASDVAISEIVPKKYYLRIGGLQSLSGSLVTILTPALATLLLTLAGIQVVLIFDLLSFCFDFFVLVFFIKIPKRVANLDGLRNKFWQDCILGFRFLKEHSALMQLILFFTFINLIAFIGGGGLTTTVTSMILLRTDQNKVILVMFSTAVGIGTFIGGLWVTLMKSPKSKTKTIFITCGVSFFLSDVFLGVGQSAWIWILAGLLGNLPLPLLNSNLAVIMRTQVPIEMQGRVFSARDALQYCTIPIGYLLSGVLAEYCFEPFMKGDSTLKHLLGKIVGVSNGSGIAVMLLFTGIIGTIVSFYGLKIDNFKKLDHDKQ